MSEITYQQFNEEFYKDFGTTANERQFENLRDQSINNNQFYLTIYTNPVYRNRGPNHYEADLKTIIPEKYSVLYAGNPILYRQLGHYIWKNDLLLNGLTVESQAKYMNIDVYNTLPNYLKPQYMALCQINEDPWPTTTLQSILKNIAVDEEEYDKLFSVRSSTTNVPSKVSIGTINDFLNSNADKHLSDEQIEEIQRLIQTNSLDDQQMYIDAIFDDVYYSNIEILGIDDNVKVFHVPETNGLRTTQDEINE